MLHSGEWLAKKYASFAQPKANQTLDTTLVTLASRLQATQSQNDGKGAPSLPSLHDRRAAVLTLKGLARDHPADVGEKALDAILESLCRDAKQDDEIARAIVETCLTLCDAAASAVPSKGAAAGQPATTTITNAGKEVVLPTFVVRHVERFLASPTPLHALLPLLSPSRSFYTRFSSLQLLGSLLRTQPERVQDHVLTSPGGCGAILECLIDNSGSSGEIVRNEALLLLPRLVAGNADIQKLIAFEGAFEKLIDVVAVEGRIEGGVVVQDALEALVALLKYNVSNQNYFRETLSVPLLAPLLFFPPPPPSPVDRQAEEEYANQLDAFAFQQWYPLPSPPDNEEDERNPPAEVEKDEQKVVNASLVLDVAALLLEGQGESKRLNQNALLSCGFTKCLTVLAMECIAPISLRAQALRVLAALLHSNRSNQDLLNTVYISPIIQVGGSHGKADVDEYGNPTGSNFDFTRLPPRPAILELVGATVNRTSSMGVTAVESLSYRAAALACFESYVHNNLEARLNIIKTMAPGGKTDTSAPVQDEDFQSSGVGSLIVEGVSQFPNLSSGPSSNSGQPFDAYRYLLSSLLFANLIRDSETAKTLARGLLFGADGKVGDFIDAEQEGNETVNRTQDDDDEDRSTLLQVLVGNLTMALREHGEATRRERAAGNAVKQIHGSAGSPSDWTRVQIGYLIVLITWLWQSPSAVSEFLKESSNLQVLIQAVNQGANIIDPLVSGLCAVTLGIAYEYGPVDGLGGAHGNSGIDGEKGLSEVDQGILTRTTMQPILHTRIGPDQFAARLTRLRDDARFKNTSPDVLHTISANIRDQQRNKAGAPASSITNEDTDGIWFDWNFVDFLKTSYVEIQRSILVEPAANANNASRSTELQEVKRQLEHSQESHTKALREIEILRQELNDERDRHASERQEFAQLSNEPQKPAVDEETLRLHESNLIRVQELTAQVQRLEAERSNDREQSVAIEAQLASLQEERDGAERQCHQALSDLERIQAERGTDRQQSVAIEAQLATLQEERDGAERRYHQALSDLDRVQAERSNDRQQFVAIEAQLAGLQEDRDGAERRYHQALSDLERTQAELSESRTTTLNGLDSHEQSKETNEASGAEEAKSTSEMERELEDLLILLDELSTKRKHDKHRMRSHGMDVSEDEDEEEDNGHRQTADDDQLAHYV